MKKGTLIFFMILTYSTTIRAQEIINLWPEEIPFSTGTITEEEYTDAGHVMNIQDPTITVYLPEKEKATGAAVVICPGGGYRLLAIKHEGHDIARWFNEFGVAGIVVKNRLPTSENITNKSEVAMTDALRAVRMVRSKAKDWGIEADKIGIMGFSAGGHLASTVGTHYDLGVLDSKDPIQHYSSRPDFMILMYPVINMTDATFMHLGSMRNLLGEQPAREQMIRFSNELQVTEDTPPTILIHSTDDKGVPVANSIRFYEALIDHGVSAELHIFNSGGHGYGLGRKDGTSHNFWPENVKRWMHDMVISK
jgi:acetyl esterase/lipase